MRATCTGLISAASLVIALGCDRDRPQQNERTEPLQREPSRAPGTTGEGRPQGVVDPSRPMTGDPKGETAPIAAREEMKEIEIDLDTAKNVELEAEIKLVPVSEGVKVVIDVEGAKPGTYRVVIHEKPDCSDIEGLSMGELWRFASVGTQGGTGTAEPGVTGTNADKAAAGTAKGTTGTAQQGTSGMGDKAGAPVAGGTPVAAGQAKGETPAVAEGARGAPGTAAVAATAAQGDVGVCTVGNDGKGHCELVLKSANLKKGDSMSLLDRSIVLHQGEKVGKTAKDYGKPLACGRISKS